MVCVRLYEAGLDPVTSLVICFRSAGIGSVLVAVEEGIFLFEVNMLK